MSAAPTRIARVFLTLLLPAAGLAACSKSPTGPDPDPDPGPKLTTVYDVDLVIRYINVRASCDKDILGNFDPGEFQYKVEVSGEGQSHTEASRGYNTVTGEYFQRNGGTTINFANETYIWRGLSKSADLKVALHGAEWDGVTKDSRMANRGASVTAPFKVSKETRTLTIGADGNECQIALVYDITWNERVVGG